jgi:hypothetical protein
MSTPCPGRTRPARPSAAPPSPAHRDLTRPQRSTLQPAPTNERLSLTAAPMTRATGRPWPLRTAGARWAGRPGSSPRWGWPASRPVQVLCPGRWRGLLNRHREHRRALFLIRGLRGARAPLGGREPRRRAPHGRPSVGRRRDAPRGREDRELAGDGPTPARARARGSEPTAPARPRATCASWSARRSSSRRRGAGLSRGGMRSARSTRPETAPGSAGGGSSPVPPI